MEANFWIDASQQGSYFNDFVGRWKDHSKSFYGGAVNVISDDGTWTAEGVTAEGNDWYIDDGKAWYHQASHQINLTRDCAGSDDHIFKKVSANVMLGFRK